MIKKELTPLSLCAQILHQAELSRNFFLKKKAQNLIFSFVIPMNPTNISAKSFNIFQLNQDKLFILYCTKETGTFNLFKITIFFSLTEQLNRK